MANANENDRLIEYLCGSLFNIQGRLRANEIALGSLLSVVCENAPELIEQIKSKITDIAELSIKMGELSTNPEIDAFNSAIKQSLQQFALIEEASKYCASRIEVKHK